MDDAMTHYFEKCVIFGGDCVIASQNRVTLSRENDAILTLLKICVTANSPTTVVV